MWFVCLLSFSPLRARVARSASAARSGQAKGQAAARCRPFAAARLTAHVNLVDLKREIPAYLSLAYRAPQLDMDDVSAFSDGVLDFWRGADAKGLASWKMAAQIAFSVSPSSAMCERVFSLLANMFPSQMDRSLGDVMQASALVSC